jgi:hypothetical protein
MLLTVWIDEKAWADEEASAQAATGGHGGALQAAEIALDSAFGLLACRAFRAFPAIPSAQSVDGQRRGLFLALLAERVRSASARGGQAAWDAWCKAVDAAGLAAFPDPGAAMSAEAAVLSGSALRPGSRTMRALEAVRAALAALDDEAGK